MSFPYLSYSLAADEKSFGRIALGSIFFTITDRIRSALSTVMGDVG
jgi:hypothetical protein